jgi:hypothetical protein
MQTDHNVKVTVTLPKPDAGEDHLQRNGNYLLRLIDDDTSGN